MFHRPKSFDHEQAKRQAYHTCVPQKFRLIATASIIDPLSILCSLVQDVAIGGSRCASFDIQLYCIVASMSSESEIANKVMKIKFCKLTQKPTARDRAQELTESCMSSL